MALLNEVTTALGTVIEWVGTVVQSLVAETGGLSELLPLLAVGIAISALMLGIKAIKSFIWGA